MVGMKGEKGDGPLPETTSIIAFLNGLRLNMGEGFHSELPDGEDGR